MTVASANKSTEDRRTAGRTVEQEQVASEELVLPLAGQEALGELVSTAKDGVLAVCVATGLGVLRALMEEEVESVVVPKHARDPDRTSVRHGHEAAEVTLGGRRVGVGRCALSATAAR